MSKTQEKITKVVALTISERLAALRILEGFKGSLSKLAFLLEDIKELAITEKDWKKAERVITPKPDGDAQWNWDDDKGGEKKVSFGEESLDYLRVTIKEKDEKGEFTLQDKAYITLKAKLG